MDQHQFDHWTASLAQGSTRRAAVRGLGAAAFGLSGLSVLASSTIARRHKKHKGGKGGKGGGGGGTSGGSLGLGEICEAGSKSCQSGLKCDTPTTQHQCSSTVDGIDAWCCVPPGGPCTGCECCGNFKCDFGDENPDGACRPNPEG